MELLLALRVPASTATTARVGRSAVATQPTWLAPGARFTPGQEQRNESAQHLERPLTRSTAMTTAVALAPSGRVETDQPVHAYAANRLSPTAATRCTCCRYAPGRLSPRRRSDMAGEPPSRDVDRLTGGAERVAHQSRPHRLSRADQARRRLRHGIDPDGATWLRADGPAPVIAAYLPIARYALHRLTAPEL